MSEKPPSTELSDEALQEMALEYLSTGDWPKGLPWNRAGDFGGMVRFIGGIKAEAFRLRCLLDGESIMRATLGADAKDADRVALAGVKTRLIIAARRSLDYQNMGDTRKALPEGTSLEPITINITDAEPLDGG